MKYSLSPKELNNWKARVTERVVECYIEDHLIPSLKQKEGWSEAILADLGCPLNTIEKALMKGDQTPIKQMPPYMQSYYRDRPTQIKSEIKKIFLEKGLSPNKVLFDKCINLMDILEVSTDGFLFKLKRTGEMKPKEKVISELDENYHKERWDPLERKFTPIYVIRTDELPAQIPIVEGEIEIIEIKAGKSNIPPHQKANYCKAIENGYFLRFFHVDLVSFERNHFEIEEKLIKDPQELTSFPLRSRRHMEH